MSRSRILQTLGFPFVGLLLNLAAGCSHAGDRPTWQRAWRVHAFVCPACSPATLAELARHRGAVVGFERERFLNPLYENCDTGADYTDIRARPRSEAAAYLAPSRLPPLASAQPLAGQVRCAEAAGTPNTVARVVIDGSRAYLLHESGAIVELR